MLRQAYFAAVLGLGFCCSCTASASAQESGRLDSFYEYARNKIGLLHYCRDQALIGQVTADRRAKAIETALERFAIGDGLAKERGDRAEKLGETGVWETANGKQDLADAADLFGTSIADLCKEFAGQTRPVQEPPDTRHVAAKVAAPHQAALNANHSTASVEHAAPPTASAQAVVPAAATLPLFQVNKWLSPLEVNKWRLNRRERRAMRESW